MQFERGKPPETPIAPYRAARIKDERWLSAGSGFEPGRAGPRLSLTSMPPHYPTPGSMNCRVDGIASIGQEVRVNMALSTQKILARISMSMSGTQPGQENQKITKNYSRKQVCAIYSMLLSQALLPRVFVLTPAARCRALGPLGFVLLSLLSLVAFTSCPINVRMKCSPNRFGLSAHQLLKAPIR
jgi:hypothetical protein